MANSRCVRLTSSLMQQMTIQQAVDAAVRHHQAGQFAQAEVIYRQILSKDPNNVDALHLWGVLACQVNRHELAIDPIRRAISLRPNFPTAYNNLGNALHALRRFDEAIACHQQALNLLPDYAEAHSN